MLTVRDAEDADLDTLLAYLGKKAQFDREVGAFSGELRATVDALRTALFGPRTFASALLCEDGAGPLGFAFYYFRFSSFAARPSLWLDDLYIDADRRRGGAGSALMMRLATIAAAQRCTHLAWTADERNLAGMTFYRKLGAEIVDLRGPQVTWRIAPESLASAG